MKILCLSLYVKYILLKKEVEVKEKFIKYILTNLESPKPDEALGVFYVK